MSAIGVGGPAAEARPQGAFFGLAALGLVGLLLSGCGYFEDDRDGGRPGDGAQATTDQGSATEHDGDAEDGTEDGAGDGGTGTDGADTEETSESDGSEETEESEPPEPPDAVTTALDAGEAPEYTDLEDHLWESMLTAESVTIGGTSPLGDSQLDDYFAEVAEDIDEDTLAEISVAGRMDGGAAESQITVGERLDLTIITVEGRTYLKGEDFADITALSSQHQNAEFVDQGVVEEVLSGRWIDLGEADEMASLSPQSLLEQWRESLVEEPEELTGQAEEREGEDVWVYTDPEAATYVVSAEEQPRLLSVEDGGTSLTLSEWDTTDDVDTPEETMTMDEVTQALIDSAPLPSETAEP